LEDNYKGETIGTKYAQLEQKMLKTNDTKIVMTRKETQKRRMSIPRPGDDFVAPDKNSLWTGMCPYEVKKR
jgi:hypothetical protein